MTKLLVSVTNLEEAKLALANEVDLIDLKNPHQGALGALPIDIIEQIVGFVMSNRTNAMQYTSATVGDLPMLADVITQQVLAVANMKVDFVKVGFFESHDYQPCLDALKQMAALGVKLIAVLFAEINYPENLVDHIKEAGFHGVMLDTAKKNGATFMHYYTDEEIVLFAEKIKNHEMMFGLAGSLSIQHLDKVTGYKPTYIGFRGGVSFGNQRTLALDASKIQVIRNAL